MNSQIFRIVLLFCIIFLIILSNEVLFGADHEASDPTVVAGELNLNGYPLTENGPINLTGEWEFYWRALIEPEELAEHNAQIVPVFDDWNNYMIDGKKLDRHGYATYAMTIKLGEEGTDQVYSMYIKSIASAYDLWINHEHITSVGEVGTNRSDMTPGNRPQVVTFQSDQSEVEVLFHVSNFHQRKSGLWESIHFGTAEQIAKQRESSMIIQVFVIGGIFIIGFYHLVLYLQRTKHKSALYLAITCFGVALRTMFLRDNLFALLFPRLDWEIAVTIEYLVALLALLFFLQFATEGLAIYIPQKINRALKIAISIYIIFVFITPPFIFTNTFIIYQILVILSMITIATGSIIAAIKRYEGAYLNLIAILVLSLAVMNDIFYYGNLISTDEFVSYGLLFYLFIQSVHIARRFNHSFYEVEQLSDKLQQLNQSLEMKVEMRTKALQVANKNLKKMEQARRRLFANVSHELNTPLTFIQGNIKAMMDGLIPKDDFSYLRTVYDDTKMMQHMITDLLMLSKLDFGKIHFSFKRVEMRSFLLKLVEKEKVIFEKNAVKLNYEEEPELQDQAIICSIDPVRIEQAMMNFLINAQKYTPVGGHITIQLEILDKNSNKRLKISITDNGTGINEDDLPYLFERFYKATNKVNSSQKGAGLGLAIAKEFIESHHGSVGVDSKVGIGKGTTFFFTLPILEVNEEK